MSLPRAVFWVLVGLGAAWICWLVLINGQRQKAPIARLLTTLLDAICGLANIFLGGAHFTAVMAHAIQGRPLRGFPVFVYNFRFYSLLMLGLLLVTPGILCLKHARGLLRGDLADWKVAFWSAIVLLVVTVPLIPLQSFATLLAGLTSLSLAGLVLTRRHFHAANLGRF